MKMLRNSMIAMTFMVAMAACSKAPEPVVQVDTRTPEQKIQANAAKKYNLTGEEIDRANNNAKQYFTKTWDIAGGQRGMVNSCRPADSNFNGKTTCTGYVPNMPGSEKPYALETIYCGYNTTILGCTDKDD